MSLDHHNISNSRIAINTMSHEVYMHLNVLLYHQVIIPPVAMTAIICEAIILAMPAVMLAVIYTCIGSE